MPIRRSDTLHQGVFAPVAPLPDEAAYQNESESEQAEPVSGGGWRPTGLLEWFAVAQTALPALLYLPGNQQSRSALRASAFLVSIAAFAFWYVDRKDRYPIPHPATRWLLMVVALLGLMVVHPQTSSLVAGFGQTALYFAVFCPIFWVPAFVVSRQKLIRVLAILLVCNGLNSVVGVLQVYDPVRWLPAQFSTLYRESPILLDISSYVGPDGRRIIRPPGLYDTPGAVCGAGTVATLLGLIFAMTGIPVWQRAIALGFSFAGMAAIYLSHVRSSFIVSLGMIAAYLAMLMIQNQKKRLTGFLGLAGALLVFALSFATLLGGTSIEDRFMTVFESDPRQFYYQTRGQQVESALTNLANEYPLGAGLARWGMSASFFQIPRDTVLWAEVQPAGWILDGGLPMVILYSLALIATLLWELKLVRHLPDPHDRLWASAVVAVNVGTLALVFTFVPFLTQLGLQFWFLEGLLHGAMAYKLYQWT